MDLLKRETSNTRVLGKKMLFPRKRIEFLLLLPISAGAFILCVPHVPLWTAGSVALLVLIAARWAGL
jgi:hypothetical protein